ARIVAGSAPENGSGIRDFGRPSAPKGSLRAVRPKPFLACEHMFPSVRTSALAQRALGALRLTRSFLLLEDDHEVDWEVDENEPSACAAMRRTPLRGVAAARSARSRPGQPAPARPACTLAIEPWRDSAPPHRTRSRASRTATGRP